ncbi:MAG: SMC family ATPase, partial [Bacteroidota bacterium]
MVPVALKLHNFLSYGTTNEPLDFEQFHVACLSGGNGQGKSALLDAITWAIWGEARKSGDNRKPDDDLLRIGQTRMEVDLTFDLEGTRYRVVRAYSKSASGKTSKPSLEFQVLDSGTQNWRPLTTPSVRETQAAIDEKIGLDYDTFINSAFLLQGRSDEFTKKKPRERKQILAQILALGRYDKLADKAREHVRQHSTEVERLNAEVERLTGALEDEGQWQQELEAAAAHQADLERQRTDAQQAQRALMERVSALEAAARDAEHQRTTLRRLGERTAALAAERDELASKVRDTEHLVARRAELMQAHERYEALRRERDDLDDKADLRRGIDTQRQRVADQIAAAQRDLDFRLKQLDADQRRDQQKLDEADQRLATRPRVEEALAKAKAAQTEVERLRAVAEQRRADEADAQTCRMTIAAERARLEGEASLLQRALDAASDVPDRAALEADLAACAVQVETLRTTRDELTQVKEAGVSLRAEIDAATTQRQALDAEIAALQEKQARIDRLDTDTCPTCGSVLTEAHRATVRGTYAGEIAIVEDRRATLDSQFATMQRRRGELGQQYRALDQQAKQHDGVEARHAQLAERLARFTEEEAERTRQRTRLQTVRDTLAQDRFATEARTRLQAAEARLAAQPFDQARYDAAQAAAGSLGRWQDERRLLEQIAGEAEGLRAAL